MVGKFKFVLLKWDVDRLRMAQVEDWWQAVLSTVMNVKFPKKAECVFIPGQVSTCHAGSELHWLYTLCRRPQWHSG